MASLTLLLPVLDAISVAVTASSSSLGTVSDSDSLEVPNKFVTVADVLPVFFGNAAAFASAFERLVFLLG